MKSAQNAMQSSKPVFEGYGMEEHGFWDYTTPGAGGMEHYQSGDYLQLLDDMQAAGMNSLAVVVKWFTTGYRSRLPFLDQYPDNPVVASDNRLLHDLLNEASRRNIKVWLVAVVSIFPTAKFKSPATSSVRFPIPGHGPLRMGIYDLDSTEVTDRAVQVFDEIAMLFPRAAGLVVEVEGSGKYLPHRMAPYNRWARQNGKPCFNAMAYAMECRIPPLEPWREYTTLRRVELLQRIEHAVRARGFRGDLAMLCETGRQSLMIAQEVALPIFRKSCPGWSAVSYECAYDKSSNRYGMMEMAIEAPRKAGLRAYYLPRGVMTWGSGVDKWTLPLSLKENWRMDLEDIARYRPEGVWWFGSGGLRKGFHVDPDLLRRIGFKSGRAARRALLSAIASFGD